MIYSHTGFMLKINDVHNHPEYAPICAYRLPKTRSDKVPRITSWKILRSSIISREEPRRKVPARFLRDEWILLHIIRLWPEYIRFVPYRLMTPTPKVVLLTAKSNNFYLKYIPGHLQTREMVEWAIIVSGENYPYIAPHLKNEETMLFAFARRYYLVEENELTEDFLLKAVRLYGVIGGAPKKMITPKIAMAAILRHTDNLLHVPDELQTVELCSVAIKRNPEAARHIRNQDTRTKLGIM